MNYGKSILNLWNLDNSITFLNNGSFGATPKKVLSKQSEYRDLMEKNPVDFFLIHAPNLLEKSLISLSKFVNSNTKNITFIDNATTAINTVLHFLLIQNKIEGEIIYTNHTYPAVVNTLKYYTELCNIKLKCLNIPYPSQKDEIIEIYQKSITKNTKIALIDTINSPTAIIFPYIELSEFFAENGIITIIDGAHSVACIDINLSNPKFDFFTSNNHKWLFAPKGSAFLWTSDKFIDKIHPLSISLNYGSNYRNEFEWQGTKDLSNWIATEDSINFYFEMGNQKIINYNNQLINSAKEIILSQIDTYTCSNEMNCCMSTFFLSDKININADTTSKLRRQFYEKYRIELPFIAFDNKLWFRISAQIFNELDDYKLLIEAINNALLNDYFKSWSKK